MVVTWEKSTPEVSQNSKYSPDDVIIAMNCLWNKQLLSRN